MAVEGSHLIIKPYETSEGFEIEIKDSQAREQISSVDSEVGLLKSDLAKNTARDKSLERKVDALYKLGEGITHQFETDSETAYQKDVPSGAKLASVKQIGGKTIVWNQYIPSFTIENIRSENGVVEVTDGVVKMTPNGNGDFAALNCTTSYKRIANHRYYLSYCVKSSTWASSGNIGFATVDGLWTGSNIGEVDAAITDWQNIKGIFSHKNDGTGGDVFSFRKYNEDSNADVYIKNAMLFDLTKMFGAGNEPSTVEEFEAMFPLDYYEYNEGTLMSAPVNEVVEQGKNLIDSYNPILQYKISLDNGVFTASDGDTATNTNAKIQLYDGETYVNVYTIKRMELGVNLIKIVKSVKSTSIRFSNNGLIKEFIVRWDISDIPVGTTLIFSVNMLDITIGAFKFTEPMLFVDGKQQTEYIPYHQTSHQIPQAILDLDGYGDSVSDTVYNYVDYENKKYHKRVGKVDIGTLDWVYGSYNNVYYLTTVIDDCITVTHKEEQKLPLTNVYESVVPNYISSPYFVEKSIMYGINTNSVYVKDSSYTDAETFKAAMSGVMLYYELAEPVITDISDLIPEDFNPIEVEAGGTLTFKNSNGDGYRIPVPNTEEYVVKLSEVGGTTT